MALDALDSQLDWLDPSEDVKSRYRHERRSIFHDALSVELARDQPGAAFQVLERYRADSLLRSMRSTLAKSGAIPPEIADELRQIGWRYDAITRQLDGLHPSRDRERFQQLVAEQSELHRRRQVIRGDLLSQRRAGASRRPPLDLEGVRQALDPGTLLLAYHVGPRRIHLFVLSSNGPLQSHELDLDTATVRLRVLLFRPLLEHPQARGGRRYATHEISRLEPGQQLFTTLLRPALDRISSAERLLILPDGPLHYLPFAALSRPGDLADDGQVLAEWKPIHTAQSATVYAELLARRPSRATDSVTRSTGADAPRWLAFGDPTYHGDSQSADLTATHRELLRLAEERGLVDRLERLPHTRREVEDIARLFGETPTRFHLGDEATEDQLRRDLRAVRYLHFATHGFAYSDDPESAAHPMDSFLALSLFDPEEAARKQLEENGLLQAWEIAHHLELDADLVVLSACQTAIGENRGGEGLISLSRAFQIAGARSVVASLWAINDASTAELMVRFYRHLLDGQPKDQALRAAQMELAAAGPIEVRQEDGKTVLRDFTDPYYWAAFQVIGDWQ